MPLKNLHKTLLVIGFFICLGSNAFAQSTPGKVSVKTDEGIDEIISEKKAFNKQLKGVKGYRIQLFYGSEKGAYKLKDEFKAQFPEMDTEVIFSYPDWKVQIGHYITRIEADSALVSIKQEFPSAIILPAMVKYNTKQ